MVGSVSPSSLLLPNFLMTLLLLLNITSLQLLILYDTIKIYFLHSSINNLYGALQWTDVQASPIIEFQNENDSLNVSHIQIVFEYW